MHDQLRRLVMLCAAVVRMLARDGDFRYHQRRLLRFRGAL
jgi:hypothetical protein